ncbi:TPA: hypothetical protein ACPZFU_003004 [Yersinia enterocolitica]|uniref:Regulatory protein n=2 Tax=root TaxID=1 RepID=A0AAE9FQJ0_9CAUD|nr:MULTISPECIES: hypothetical protein [Yersinia]YP_010664157.1 hypothetical protein PQA65_gp03 [Yersinia phage vB_YenM_42.18]EKN3326784.1 hypothetical protein [Yersinia enterocolitica]EKN3365498.1 hypothetical protein [Yersinia enterocolitica]EKN3382032.1 hypothetical protein [Yersinia enterocolitica]EKN3399214.1 hypothetical protein [Yersinia enterocolitica]EKN3407877.1 hypothetical protein [Yersinia enterocolitica]
MSIDRKTMSFAEPEPITPREFCSRTGRSYGSVVNMMDRNQLPVHREGRPGTKRPRRFIMWNEYLEAMAKTRALCTGAEREWIENIIRKDALTVKRNTKAGQSQGAAV